MTVEQLKNDGYKVHFTHVRRFEIGDSGFFIEAPRGAMGSKQPNAHGGGTICEVFLGDALIASGESYCSERDNFCRKIGRDIALGRAVAELTGKAEIRRARKEDV